MIRLCAVVALGCALGLSSVALAEVVTPPVTGGKAKLRYAEEAARQAVHPLPAERKRKTRVVVSNVSFEFTGVTP